MSFISNIKGWFATDKQPIQQRSGVYMVGDHYAGAWQRNDEKYFADPSAFHAVYSCQTRIASDIGKLPIRLVKKDANNTWKEHESAAFSPVLRRPNKYQTTQQFFEQWLFSLLSHGNTYALKERDQRGVVVALYILDPTKVRPVTAQDGSYAYEVDTSDVNELAGIAESTVLVPPEEMIHDRLAGPNSHPLLGVSPIFAAASQIAVAQQIQNSAQTLHKNHARPGGILTASGAVSDDTVQQLRNYWEANYTGNNAGKVAVLADGLQYKSFDTINAQNAQVVEQLQWSATVVCSVYSVPPHMVMLGDGALKYDNIAALNQQYYNQTLMPRLEAIEALLNHGLGLAADVSTEFDVTNLLRLDPAAAMEAQSKAIGAGLLTPNEGRKALNYGPLDGGDTVYLQQQMWPIGKLADRRDLPGANDNTDINRHFRTMQKIKRIADNAA